MSDPDSEMNAELLFRMIVFLQSTMNFNSLAQVLIQQNKLELLESIFTYDRIKRVHRRNLVLAAFKESLRAD